MEECQLPECGVCKRQDMHQWETCRHIVTYLGEYAVVTSLSPDFIPYFNWPRFVTIVGYVGDGSLADSEEDVPDEEFPRYYLRHDSHEKGEEVHFAVVESIKNGLIDVSAPLSEEEAANQLEW